MQSDKKLKYHSLMFCIFKLYLYDYESFSLSILNKLNEKK